jgi:hypothetical protein
MRVRLAQIWLVALAAFVAAAVAAPAAEAKRAPARVKTIGCRDGDDMVTFRGRMRPVRGTTRMAMRFSIRERRDDGHWTKLKAPGLGKLRRSRRGVRKFVFDQKVAGLEQGHRYRAVVRFAWYDRRGRRIRRARRRSRVCRAVGPLPNLRVVRIRQQLTPPAGTARYAVRVENNGTVAADKVPVLLSVDGGVLDTREIPRLEPGASDVVHFTGPACQRVVVAEADPADEIRELNGRDNRLFRSCSL